jgi:2-polyprenyl-3-methyl-5-hydroxy-6-metoxy-1,4-benzoquinol methylase
MSTLLVPDLRRGHGTGHLRRCLKLLSVLDNSQILLPHKSSETERGRDELGGLIAQLHPEQMTDRCVDEPAKVVLDLFEASARDVLLYGSAVTIGIDTGGDGREYCSYLVDTLPRLGGSPANVGDPAFLDLPEFIPISERDRGRILVTFGGEDPAGLTESTVALLVGRLGISPDLVTVVRPGLRALSEIPDGVLVTGPLPTLWPALGEHEWVICSHGMTAFEAAAAGRSVVTVNPTRYHDQLAAKAGFVRAGVKQPDVRRLSLALCRLSEDEAVGVRESHAARRSLAELISGVHAGHVGCPAHPGERGRVVWRNTEKSYFGCPVCETVYLERFRGDEERYGVSYFDDEYKKQYGKTYLDDFAVIKEMGHRRLHNIRAVNPDGATILDIGCAYGPFLQVAAESGMQPFGIDVSAEAVGYVTDTLKLPAWAGSVLDADPELMFGRKEFDIVALWYVIEHFSDLQSLMSRIAGWVRPGGVLAFATPNLMGVSGRRNRDTFLDQSPRDHHTILSPRSARNIISEHGFRVRRVVSTGHHPERYPSVRRWRLPGRAAMMHSRLFGMGDTFELYAERLTTEPRGANE